ncbi:MAG: GNAT family N-acetyltransferase [Clostridia bacterium]
MKMNYEDISNLQKLCLEVDKTTLKLELDYKLSRAEVDNKIIGKVHLEISDTVSGIYGLGVLSEYRGKGYGRGILTRAIEKLKENNSKDIMLQVVVKNIYALNLYKSFGFQETSTMDYYRMCKLDF